MNEGQTATSVFRKPVAAPPNPVATPRFAQPGPATQRATPGSARSQLACGVFTPQRSEPSESRPELNGMNLLWLALLTVITFQLYIPVWFLNRRNAINSLRSPNKLGAGVFVFVLVVFSVGLMLSIAVPMDEEFTEIGTAEMLFISWAILEVVAGITLLVQLFKARRIFDDHFTYVSFSRIATFFLGIWYLQYKINRL